MYDGIRVIMWMYGILTSIYLIQLTQNTWIYCDTFGTYSTQLGWTKTWHGSKHESSNLFDHRLKYLTLLGHSNVFNVAEDWVTTIPVRWPFMPNTIIWWVLGVYNTARLHVVVDPGICENWKATEIPLIIHRSDQLGMGLMGGIQVCDNLHIWFIQGCYLEWITMKE